MKRRGWRHAKRLPEAVADILLRMDALPTLDDRPEDEIVGYDENGLPGRNKPVPPESTLPFALSSS